MRALALFAFAACSGAAPINAPARVATPPEVTYTFRYAGSTLEVTLDAPADASGITAFSIDRFADVDDPETSMRDVRARLVGGAELQVEAKSPHVWRVRAPAGSRIVLRYTLFSTHPPTTNDRFRTIVTAKLVHFVGTLALAQPSSLGGEGKHDIRFTWEGLGRLKPASSFGAHASETVRDTLDSFRAGVFLAADDLRVTRRSIGDGVLDVATVGKLAFSDAALADRAAKVIAIERAFFSDEGTPYFFISAWPLGTGMSYGGTGYTHSFDLALSPEVPLDADIDNLLAHEHFHTWNGQKITPEAFEELTYWFTEGFTDFYAARLRYRGGLLSLESYAVAINAEISAYLTSPVKELSNARAVAGFWKDEMVTGKIPYFRGNAIALVVDREIRRESDGRTSLDDVMRALVEAHDPRITSERVLAMIESLTSTAFTARIRATAIDGAPLAIPANLFAPCLAGTIKRVWTYDLGFDWTATDKAKTIVGVRPGSEAAKAGVHDGDAVKGVSIYFGDVDKQVELHVGSPVHTIAYLPRGKALDVPVFAPGDATACDAILGAVAK